MFSNDKKDVYEVKKPINKGLIFFIFLIILLIFIASFSTVTIDSGEIGVPVLFGKVQNYTLEEGIHVILPIMKIVKFPTRIQSYTESSRGQNAIIIKTKDGLTVGVDITVWFYLEKEKAFDIYREIARNYTEIIPKILTPSIRTVVRDVAVRFTVEDLYTNKREEFVKMIFQQLKNILKEKYIIINKVLVRRIVLPKQVEDAIARKLKTKQESEEMKYKKEIAKKQAEIREIEARGIAKAQEIINSTLTPNYIQFKAIEVYKELVNSKNTTFVIMPTSPNGAGIPLILNGTK